jgi:hypothetical protein
MAATPNAPNRLLAASRVVHQLWRTQDKKVELNKLLEDEAFARSLLSSSRVYADPKTSALLDDFEKSSLESGAWRADSVHAKPAYIMNPDGTISAAAAWDPDYNPPESAQDITHEVDYVPTTSPRTSMTAKDKHSSFISRFGFSRPAEPSDRTDSPRNSQRSVPPSGPSGNPSTQAPAAEPADGPIDPNHKKYIRGAR